MYRAQEEVEIEFNAIVQTHDARTTATVRLIHLQSN